MRTPVLVAKLEMGRAVIGNAPLYVLTIATVEALISHESIVINVDLPSDATAMIALVGDTFKAFIIFRCI